MSRRQLLLVTAFVLLGVIAGGFAYWLFQPPMPSQPSAPGKLTIPSRLTPIAKADAFAEEYREAAQKVAASLTASGEKAEDFYTEEVEPKRDGRILVFHLWHVSAFEPQNQNMAGNPGGECRDVEYDTAQHKVTSTLFWQ
jgi:hypothetical protein